MKKKDMKKLISILVAVMVLGFYYIFDTYQLGPTTDSTNKRVEEAVVTSNENLEVTFLDVGQADSILLECGSNNMLIDAGNNEDGEKIVSYLEEEGITDFSYVVGTHPHEDHIGGLDDIINNFQIETFYMPDVVTTTKTFEDVLTSLEKNNVLLSIPSAGDTFTLGDAKVKVLYVGTEEESDLNDTSIILKVTYKGVSFLFTGDASTKIENQISEEDLKSTVLKVGHHGSKTSTNKTLLESINPSYAVISVGKDNQYKHPEEEVLSLLNERNIKTYRTDEDETIKMITDGSNIEINALKTDTNG